MTSDDPRLDTFRVALYLYATALSWVRIADLEISALSSFVTDFIIIYGLARVLGVVPKWI